MAIEDADLETTAASPSEIQTNEGRVKERPVSEQIAVDRYTSGRKVANVPPYGLRFARIEPGGTLGRS